MGCKEDEGEGEDEAHETGFSVDILWIVIGLNKNILQGSEEKEGIFKGLKNGALEW